MMYIKTVIACNQAKYTKASISKDCKERICKTCDRALARGSMPPQAKANGLELPEIPPELAGLWR